MSSGLNFTIPQVPRLWAEAAAATTPIDLSEIFVRKACVIGGGAFGTALATVLAHKGALVNVWVRDEAQAEAVNDTKKNEKYLPDFSISENIVFVSDINVACKEAELVLLATPTPFLRNFLIANRSVFPVGIPIVLCAKGIEIESLETPYDIVRGELPGKYSKFIAVLAGPSFAKEIMQQLPTSVTVASEDPSVAFLVTRQMCSRMGSFRCYPSYDIIGCEIAGAVKNVLAIVSGAAHGFKLGNNARAAMMCRGLGEMRRLSLAMGSDGSCLSGLAGMGDLVLTCSSELSRNFTVGLRLAAGEPASTFDIKNAGGKGVAEGVPSAKSIKALCEKLSVEMPLCDAAYAVLYQGKGMAEALKTLQDRPLSIENNTGHHAHSPAMVSP